MKAPFLKIIIVILAILTLSHCKNKQKNYENYSEQIDSVKLLYSSDYKLAKALELKNRLLKVKDNFSEDQLSDFYHYLSVLYAKIGYFDSAMYYLDKFLENSTKNSNFIFYEDKIQIEDADYKNNLEPYTVYFTDKGELFRYLEVYERAIIQYKNALRFADKKAANILYINLALCYMAKKDSLSTSKYLDRVNLIETDTLGKFYFYLLKAQLVIPSDSAVYFLKKAKTYLNPKMYLEYFELFNSFTQYYLKKNNIDSARKFISLAGKYLNLMKKNLDFLLPETKNIYDTYINYFILTNQNDKLPNYIDSLKQYEDLLKNNLQKTLATLEELKAEKKRNELLQKVYISLIILLMALVTLIYFITKQTSKFHQEKRINSTFKLLSQIENNHNFRNILASIIEKIKKENLFPKYDIISFLIIDRDKRLIKVTKELTVYKNNDTYSEYAYSFDDKNSLAAALYREKKKIIFSNNIQKNYKSWVEELKDGNRPLLSGKKSVPAKSVIYVSIFDKSEIIAIFTIQSLKKNAFSNTDLLIAEIITKEIAEKYNYIKSFQEAEKKAQMFETIIRNRTNYLLNRILPLKFIVSKINNSALTNEFNKFYLVLQEESFSVNNLKNNEDVIYLSQIVELILQSYQTLIQENNINVQKNIPRNVTLKTNSFFLFSILNELIVNAIKHNKNIDLEINFKANIKIDGQNYYQIIIKDTGKGLPEFVLNNIGSVVEYKGSGLMIVFSFIEFLNGKIEYETSENGTEFNIFIPKPVI